MVLEKNTPENYYGKNFGVVYHIFKAAIHLPNVTWCKHQISITLSIAYSIHDDLSRENI
jgi:hypothetical protein